MTAVNLAVAADLPAEAYRDWAEGLVMVDGEIVRELGGEALTLRPGDCVRIPAGTIHAIRPGGTGAFLLVDPEGLV